jgi:hypothetical protein
MEVVEKREISWPLPRIEPRFRDRPVHSLITETGIWKTYLISVHTTRLGRLTLIWVSDIDIKAFTCLCMYRE